MARQFVIALVVAGVLGSAAGGTSASATVSDGGSEGLTDRGTSAATSTNGIYGRWSARMTKDQLLDYGMVDPRFPGTWRLEVKRNGTMKWYNPLDGWMPATVKVSGSRLFVTGTPTCEGGSGDKGVYRWTITKRKLRLSSIVPDTCGGRWQTLAVPVWTRA